MKPKSSSQTIFYRPNRGEDLIPCKITFDPLPSSIEKKLSLLEMKRYLQLLEQAQWAKIDDISEMKILYDNHSDIPEIVNLYTFVLIQKKEIAQAENLIEENYLKNPDYLFAKINFADQCLRKKKIEKIPEIFPSFSLTKLFPQRKVFHFTEFRGFMVLMGFYHLALKQKEMALECYQAAFQADPAHLSVIALEKKVIKPSFLRKILCECQKLSSYLPLRRRSS